MGGSEPLGTDDEVTDREMPQAAGTKAATGHRRSGGRVNRALRLDPTLYREMAVANGGTWLPVLVVLLAAAAAGLAAGARYQWHFAAALRVQRDGLDIYRLYFDQSWIQIVGLNTLAQVVAWPIWAASVWLIGRYVAAPGNNAKLLVVARALGLAQAPGVFAVVVLFFFPLVVMAAEVVVPYEPYSAATGLASHRVVVIARTLGLSVQSLLSVWVLVGTFLAVRETLQLSNGRALVTLIIAGIGVAILFGFSVAMIALATPPSTAGFDSPSLATLGLTNRVDRLWIPGAASIAGGLDFNLSFGRPLMWLFDLTTD